jgi:membrane protease YdiL (CAAX protease family)
VIILRKVNKLIITDILLILTYIFFITIGIRYIAKFIIVVFNTSNGDLINVVANLIMYIILTIICLIVLRRSLVKEFKSSLTIPQKGLNIFIGYLILIGSSILGQFVLTLLGYGEAQSANQQGIEALLESKYMLMIYASILIGPIVEEIIFRKVMFELFVDKLKFSIYPILILSSLLFGSIHVIFNATENISELVLIIPYFFQGLALGYIYLKNNRNIYIPLAVHILSNFIAGLIILFQ